jgi:branched-chain amino acid transport system permease protein
MNISTLTQHLIQGTALGATYGLVALGYSMQFSAMRLVNFAHGESFALGAFVALALSGIGGLSYGLVLVVTLVLMAAIGVVVEQLAIRPLYKAPDLNMLIATIGLSIVLRQAINLIWGADARPFASSFGDGSFRFDGVTASYQQLGTIFAAVALMAALDLFLTRTRQGIAMRAVAQDEATAQLMGIRVARVRSLVFAISTALGAAAGILFASLTYAVFDMGLWMGMKGFAAAVLGGLGSMPGAVVGGFILGLIEQLSSGYISSLYRDTAAFSVLVLVLLVRPQGLFGRRGSPWGKV